MIVFASICPHPPIIVPEVAHLDSAELVSRRSGRSEARRGGQKVSRVKKTVAAMEKLARDFANARVDTIIIISPHGPIFADRFNTRFAETFVGDLSMFGAPEVKLELPGNQKLARAIANAATGINLPTELLTSPELDHGVIVPLYFLLKNLSYSPTLIPIGFSNLPLADHYQFGAIIARVCEDKVNRIAVIASGDLSHRLTPEAPAGYSPRGQEFDEKLVDLLRTNDAQGIINLDPQLIEDAGECGLRSIIILLGAITAPPPEASCPSKPWRNGMAKGGQLLSYEGPFGVGYLVAKLL